VNRRQRLPGQWLIIDGLMSAELWSAVRRLRRGSGVLVLGAMRPSERRRLRHIANLRQLIVISE
jgi:hypothetical protein